MSRLCLNVLLLAGCLVVAYTAVWEFSTRSYLRGFSDAIIPASATPVEKIDALLSWMSHGPARRSGYPESPTGSRDPADSLNYAALLRVCGSATNAFINLADSSNLEARRLLLLDPNHGAKHVVAEVLVDRRWIVVDPSFHFIPRRADGQLLTRDELANSSVLAAATQGIVGYNPSYSYEYTAHVHLARIPFLGERTRRVLNHLYPRWEDTVTTTLLLERASFAAMVASMLFLVVIILLRASLTWYGERQLGIHRVPAREQFRRAVGAVVTPPD